MLAWLDLETSALNPREGRILEVGLIVTSDDLVEIWRVSQVCRFLGDLERVDPVIRDMHRASGLWDECAKTEATTMTVESELVAMLLENRVTGPDGKAAREHTVPLAGSNIGFDKAWLREHMPRLLDCFHYRSVDVSTLTELARRWFPSVYESRPGAGGQSGHRALADLENSIALLKYYRAMMFRERARPGPLP
jgi:oligoribonuclease